MPPYKITTISMALPVGLAILYVSFAAAQLTVPERRVQGNLVISERDPKLEIQLPGSVQYAGADRWVLYGIADCELHAFVAADQKKSVQKLYWVQFEGYIPSRPELKHQYDSPRHTEIGGMDFYVDTWIRADNEKIEPGSDRQHIEALIRNQGYKMPAGMMYVRLVHLLDEQKRKELMIIYGEDLASAGFAPADLAKGGKAYDQWPVIENGLVERAEQQIVFKK